MGHSHTGLRLTRKSNTASDAVHTVQTVQTTAIVPVFYVAPGIADRWLFNLKSPSFCTMVLCHGSCTDPLLSRVEANQNFVHADVLSKFRLSAGRPVSSFAMGEQCQPDLGCRLHGLFN